MIYFTADLHIGHSNIYKYRKEFSSCETHDMFMLTKVLSLSKKDTLYILGDFILDCKNYNKYIDLLSYAKCNIKLVMGNHDSLKLLEVPVIKCIQPLYSYKGIWLSHCPIHPYELNNKNKILNVHGHLHHNDLLDNRYFNVNIDRTVDYSFVPLKAIKARFKECEMHNLF